MWDLTTRLRADCPVSRPADGYLYSANVRRDRVHVQGRAPVLVGGRVSASGTVVPEEESLLGEIDPPTHTHLRRLLHRSFTPMASADTADFTRRLTLEMLDELQSRRWRRLYGNA